MTNHWLQFQGATAGLPCCPLAGLSTYTEAYCPSERPFHQLKCCRLSWLFDTLGIIITEQKFSTMAKFEMCQRTIELINSDNSP